MPITLNINNFILALTIKVLVFISFFSSSAQSDEPIREDCSTPIKISWVEWPSVHSRNESGEIEGYDIELITYALDEIDCEYQLIEMPWKRTLRAIEMGHIDMTVGASITKDRSIYANFSQPYRREEVCIAHSSANNSFDEFFSLHEFAVPSFRVGAMLGVDYGQEWINFKRKHKAGNGQLLETYGFNTLFSWLLHNRVDIAFVDCMGAAKELLSKSLSSKIKMHKYRLHTGNVHVMYSKKSVPKLLQDKINDAITYANNSPKHDELVEKYSFD